MTDVALGVRLPGGGVEAPRRCAAPAADADAASGRTGQGVTPQGR
ncbi:hypothetical protein [Streptomyces misionensis]